MEAIDVETVATLAAARERLAKGGVDVVLLDLGLPDGRGADSVLEISLPVAAS
jgi:DNA-binding response OmpR family regulator